MWLNSMFFTLSTVFVLAERMIQGTLGVFLELMEAEIATQGAGDEFDSNYMQLLELHGEDDARIFLTG